ncbi:unnamed protein product [Gadus morhua 'NCC']
MCVSFVRVFRVAITHQCMLSHVAELLCTCDFSVCGPFRSERSGKKNTWRRRTHATLLLGRALCCCIQGPQRCRGGLSLSKGSLTIALGGTPRQLLGCFGRVAAAFPGPSVVLSQ